MHQMRKGDYIFFAREYPEFHDEWVINEIWDTDNYRIRPEMFTGKPIVDVGANCGDFSVYGSQYATVYAYEPQPDNFKVLQMNVAANKLKHPIITIQKGIGQKGTFTINNDSGSSQIGLDGDVCECIDLNEALKDFDEIDLLKFDIEGSEYDLFENASHETMLKIRNMVGELHSWRWDDKERHQALLDKLDKYFVCERWGYLDSTIGGKRRFNPNMAVGIKTFMREDSLFRLLDSVDQHLQEYKIYIADDSEIGNKKGRYEQLKEKGNKVIELPFDSGLSAGRNTLMETIEEPFILYCDDDYIFGKDNGVKEVLEIMKKRPDIGMICGLLTCSGQELGFNLNEGKWEEVNGIKLCQTDRGLNFFIARKEMFKDVKWNPKFKINNEHEDFFKRIPKKWKVYYCPTLKAEHEGRKPAGEYEKYRNRNFCD